AHPEVRTDPADSLVNGRRLRGGRNGVSEMVSEMVQEPFLGRPLLRRVFSNPHCATAFRSHGSEPYGRLFFIASRIRENLHHAQFLGTAESGSSRGSAPDQSSRPPPLAALCP